MTKNSQNLAKSCLPYLKPHFARDIAKKVLLRTQNPRRELRRGAPQLSSWILVNYCFAISA